MTVRKESNHNTIAYEVTGKIRKKDRYRNLISERGLRCVIGYRFPVEDLVKFEKYAVLSPVEVVMIFSQIIWCPVQFTVQTCRTFHHRYRSLQISHGKQIHPGPSCIYVKGPWYCQHVSNPSPPDPYWTLLLYWLRRASIGKTYLGCPL